MTENNKNILKSILICEENNENNMIEENNENNMIEENKKKKNKKKDISKLIFVDEKNNEKNMTNNNLKKIMKEIGLKIDNYIPIKYEETNGRKTKKVLEHIYKFKNIKKRKDAIELGNKEYGINNYELLSNYNLKNTNYGIIDIDDFSKTPETLHKYMIEKFKFLKDCYAFTGTTKGLRFLVEYDNNINPYYKGTHTKIMKDFDGDWIKDPWWNTLDKEIFI